MATLEELQQQLAALQAKVNAITEPPDDYYTSRYSGEELDNIADNANKWAETDKLVRQLPGQNLLDNSVFLDGCLVDQRGGWIIPPRTALYTNADFSGESATVGNYLQAVEISDTYCKWIGTDKKEWYAKKSDCVRGYTGYGYGIDRWMQYYGTLKIQNDIIELPGFTSGGTLEQKVEKPKRFAGKTMTLSVLGNRTGGSWYITVRQDGVYRNINLMIPNDFSCASITFAVDSTLSNELAIVFACWDESDVAEIKAAKLELGTQQTLAHQDENGNWVLNEIPDYGEQLARCQRYAVDITPPLLFNTAYLGTIDDGGAVFMVPLPVTLRESNNHAISCNPSDIQVFAQSSAYVPTSVYILQITATAAVIKCVFIHSLQAGILCEFRKRFDSAKFLITSDL